MIYPSHGCAQKLSFVLVSINKKRSEKTTFEIVSNTSGTSVGPENFSLSIPKEGEKQ